MSRLGDPPPPKASEELIQCSVPELAVSERRRRHYETFLSGGKLYDPVLRRPSDKPSSAGIRVKSAKCPSPPGYVRDWPSLAVLLLPPHFLTPSLSLSHTPPHSDQFFLKKEKSFLSLSETRWARLDVWPPWGLDDPDREDGAERHSSWYLSISCWSITLCMSSCKREARSRWEGGRSDRWGTWGAGWYWSGYVLDNYHRHTFYFLLRFFFLEYLQSSL